MARWSILEMQMAPIGPKGASTRVCEKSDLIPCPICNRLPRRSTRPAKSRPNGSRAPKANHNSIVGIGLLLYNSPIYLKREDAP
jgi:hypothetical protein